MSDKHTWLKEPGVNSIMPQENHHAIVSDLGDREIITSDQLTIGDIIKHGTDDLWQVISEPQYTCSGIKFEVLWLDVDSPDNTSSRLFCS